MCQNLGLHLLLRRRLKETHNEQCIQLEIIQTEWTPQKEPINRLGIENWKNRMGNKQKYHPTRNPRSFRAREGSCITLPKQNARNDPKVHISSSALMNGQFISTQPVSVFWACPVPKGNYKPDFIWTLTKYSRLKTSEKNDDD